MNDWKQQLISYIEKINDDVGMDNAFAMLSEELIRLKNEEFAKMKQQKIQVDMEISELDGNTDTKPMPLDNLVKLYRELFYGRQDVFATRWENAKAGTHGYAPKCKNEWVDGICGKKQKIKGACKKCAFKENQPIDNLLFKNHFIGAGRNAISLGIYPLLENETCRFLAIDFDKGNWKSEILAAKKVYLEYGMESYIERSRSGNGGHLWIFFRGEIESKMARTLGIKVLETAMSRMGIIKFDSFDRLFPNQDRMPQGGYGNLIALPLQRQAVENQNSVFVDDAFRMYASQTALLQSIIRYNKDEVIEVLGKFPNVILDDICEKEIAEEDKTIPWEKKATEKIPNDLLKKIDVVLYDRIYVDKSELHPFIKKKLIGLTVFHNQEYFLARNMRKSVQDIPMWIQCFEEDNDYLILPIGCMDTVVDICNTYKINVNAIDKRCTGHHIEVNFHGDLRPKQLSAVEELLSNDNGILHANTAFGKTIAAIAMIAEHHINTLIIVDRVDLMKQWCERLSVFLNIPKKEIGMIGGGKKNPNGNIDIAVSQSLYHNNEVSELVKGYGQIICDECHHVSAVGFEQILKSSPAKYKYGLTATLKRKDGKERIVLMQLGPVRYKDLSKVSSELEHKVYVKNTGIARSRTIETPTTNELYDFLQSNSLRNKQIVMDVRNALDENRFPIILTERKEHVELLATELEQYVCVYKLYGGLKKKEKEATMDELLQLSDDKKRVVIATSKYVGEGFDYPILDTLFLTLPISWSGRVKQYAGRLHRDYHEKREVRIYDYLDVEVEDAMKMYGRRSKGYRSMGYEIIEEDQN